MGYLICVYIDFIEVFIVDLVDVLEVVKEFLAGIQVGFN